MIFFSTCNDEEKCWEKTNKFFRCFECAWLVKSQDFKSFSFFYCFLCCSDKPDSSCCVFFFSSLLVCQHLAISSHCRVDFLSEKETSRKNQLMIYRYSYENQLLILQISVLMNSTAKMTFFFLSLKISLSLHIDGRLTIVVEREIWIAIEMKMENFTADKFIEAIKFTLWTKWLPKNLRENRWNIYEFH